MDAGIVSFGRLSFRSGGHSDDERRSFGEDPVTTSAGSHGNTCSHRRLKGDASTLKLASLRFEVYHGGGGWGA
ncbi:MAG: hypothetical protein ABSH47_05145 [Bryobacteraceae bacterium]